MKVEQIYTGCIAHAAYYIESNGVAAVFDPLREVQPYIDRAQIDNAEIKYVFETHFHADFVNGHLAQFTKDKPFILNCAGGYRSMTAAFILKQRGWDNFVDVTGGFKKISKTTVPKSEYVCPTTLL